MPRRIGPVVLALVALAACTSSSAGTSTVARRRSRPGDLVRAEAVAPPVPGARAWRVLYHSRSLSGRDITVSGFVVAPATSGRGRPVVSWAHGTTGGADRCAPSRAGAHGVPYIRELVAAGYVVAATDYEGLGTPGPHPYLVGESEGRGALDAARAAQHLHQAGAGRRVVVWGHSQGGHAALFAGQIAPSYAPELHIAGVIAGAPAAELSLLLPATTNFPAFRGFVVTAAVGYAAVYPQARLDRLFTPAVVARAPIVQRECQVAVNAAFDRPGEQLFRRDPMTISGLPELLTRNTPGNVRTRAPLLVVQGAADTLVPAFTTDAFVTRACAKHDTLDYRKYPGADHVSVIGSSQNDVLTWIANRIDGKRATTTCG